MSASRLSALAAAGAAAVLFCPALARAWVPPRRLGDQSAAGSRPPEVAAAVPGKGVVFVGRSGQIYRPAGAGVWRRAEPGGVSVNLVGAVRGSDGAIVGVATHTPLFTWEDGAWRVAFLPGHGPLALARGGGPVAVAVGRVVYLLDGARWRRIAVARRRITALWASSPRRVYVVTAGGHLARGHGRSWRPIRAHLVRGDAVAFLAGLPGHTLCAVSRKGRVLSVRSRAAVPMAIPHPLSSLDVQAGGATASAVLLAGVGDVGGASGGARHGVLVRAKGGALRVVADVGALANGDRFVAVVRGAAGDAVAVTRDGRVFTVHKGGEVVAGRVRSALPAAALRTFAGRGPARTR